MPRIWTVLLLAVGALWSSRSLAAPDHCDPSRIRSELEASGQFPKLRGCNPDVVRNALGDSDYGFRIESRDSSNRIQAGLIIRQRVQGNTVFVVVSTGPDAEGNPPPAAIGKFLGQVLVGALQNPQPPKAQPPPPVVQIKTPLPQPPEPADAQPVFEPSEQPVEVAEVDQEPVVAPAAAQPAANPKPKPQPAKSPPEAAPAAKAPALVAVAVPPSLPLGPPPPVAPPPPEQPIGIASHPAVPRFSIAGSTRVQEGDALELQIRREGSDHERHRLVLSYSDASLLGSAPTSFEYGSDLPDVITLRLPTKKSAKREGDRDLAVTLVSADRAEVGRPDSILAVIIDRTSWWDELRRLLGSVPAWAIALAAAAIAVSAGLGLLRFLLPHATCSIGGGRPMLGPIPLRNSWPALHVDTSIGGAAFSIPHPLPTGGRTHA